jgi:hypothetical protein
MRKLPELSTNLPQLVAMSAHVEGTHGTHWLFEHISPAMQPPIDAFGPQLCRKPVTQAPATEPHLAPAIVQAKGMLYDAGHGHWISPSQPSESEPHVPEGRSAHVLFAHVSQTNVTASQTWPDEQPSQTTVLPQPSGKLPHLPVHDTGWQVTH